MKSSRDRGRMRSAKGWDIKVIKTIKIITVRGRKDLSVEEEDAGALETEVGDEKSQGI